VGVVKPYYSHAGIEIYHGDCRDVLAGMADSSVDVVVTDPPYGVKKTTEYDDSIFPTFWIPDALRIAPRVLCMPGNTALIQAGEAFGDAYRDVIVLHNSNGMTRSPIGFGNWIPVIAAGAWKWEGRPNHIRFTVETTETIDHPSPKPLMAMRRLLTYYTVSDWTILDPFMGSGSTLRAAKDLGRRAIGIELEERYCEIAAKRLSQEAFDFEGVA